VAELSIGEVAERSGTSASALRFYEANGLISAQRSAGGQRRYPRDVLRRLAVIQAAQHVGFTLAEIAPMLDVLPDQGVSKTQWSKLARGWRPQLDERIRLLERLRDQLTRCIGCGCLSLDVCALANPDDRLGTQGAGPRVWLADEEQRDDPV
jgi:MerR family transcriptional regulator, redox-sensitive transcriptional activator SoxR